jgi:hypothetical protein
VSKAGVVGEAGHLKSWRENVKDVVRLLVRSHVHENGGVINARTNGSHPDRRRIPACASQ